MAKFVVTASDGLTREVDIDHEMTLGRHDGNEIVVKEEKASRRHCRVVPKPGRVMLEDLKSSNGTRVNGHRIKAEYVLKHGDVITIGGTKIVFQDPSQENLDRTMVLPADGEEKPPNQSDFFSHESDVSVTADVARAKKKIEVASAAVEEPVELEEAEDDSDEVVEEDDADVEEEEEDEEEDDLKLQDNKPKDKAPQPRPVSAERSETARTKRSVRRAGEEGDGSSSMIKLAAAIVFVATVAVVAIKEKEWHLFGKPPVVVATNHHPDSTDPIRVTDALPDNSRVPPIPPIPAIPAPPGPVVPPIPPLIPDNTTKVSDPPPVAGDSDAKLQEQLTKVLADRDRALASRNFQGAHAVILSFASKHADGAVGNRARQEWKETDQLIASALEAELTEAKKSASEKKYSAATRNCTRIMSSDPSGKFGGQARELLQQLDEQSEPRFTELHDQATAELRAARLQQASETLGKALDELSGTKWATVLSADQIEAVMADNLLQQIEMVRLKKAAGGKEAPIKVASKKIDGVLTKVSGVNFDIRTANGAAQAPIKTVDPGELNKLLDWLELPGRHLQQSYLWLALDRKDAARAEMERALQDPAQAPAAAKLAVVAFEMKNLHVWDFSKWQHQGDWEVISGSWSTQKGRYVLESTDGGDTSLRPAAIGGPFPAKNARISFDFDLNAMKSGYAFIFEFGTDEQHTVSAVFSATGLTLNSTIGNLASAPDPMWKPGTTTHVDITIKGDNFIVDAGGKAQQTLQVQGLSDLSGTISFRARETSCTVGTVILRSAD